MITSETSYSSSSSGGIIYDATNIIQWPPNTQDPRRTQPHLHEETTERPKNIRESTLHLHNRKNQDGPRTTIQHPRHIRSEKMNKNYHDGSLSESRKAYARKYSREHPEKTRAWSKKSRLKMRAKNPYLLPRVYCDVDYFKTIDAPEKAYWVGFICADGHIHWCDKPPNQKYELIITLQQKDEAHLRDFSKAINMADDAVRIRTTHDIPPRIRAVVTVGKKQFVNHLINVGVPYNRNQENHHLCKSYTLSGIPIGVPSQYYSDFWRGLFDGDGCSGTYRMKGMKHGIFNVSLIGTKNICTNFSKFLGLRGSHVYPISKKTTAWQFSFKTGTQVERIFLQLYGGRENNICLQRKKSKFIQFMEACSC